MGSAKLRFKNFLQRKFLILFILDQSNLPVMNLFSELTDIVRRKTMISEILKFLEEFDEENAVTIREISDWIKEEEKKVAGILLRLRKQGLVAFEKRKVDMLLKINYLNDNKTAERTHKAETFHYWGIPA